MKVGGLISRIEGLLFEPDPPQCGDDASCDDNMCLFWVGAFLDKVVIFTLKQVFLFCQKGRLCSLLGHGFEKSVIGLVSFLSFEFFSGESFFDGFLHRLCGIQDQIEVFDFSFCQRMDHPFQEFLSFCVSIQGGSRKQDALLSKLGFEDILASGQLSGLSVIV